MVTIYSDTLQLVHAAMHKSTPVLSDSVDWAQVYCFLKQGKLLGVTYRCVSTLPEAKRPPEDLLNQWKAYAFHNGLKQMISVSELARVLSTAYQKGLHPITFKGILLATLYPEPNMRFSSDADIFISPQERSTMEQLLTDLGYSKIEKCSKEHVPVYKNEEASHKLTIELHDCLWEDYVGKQTELLESLHLTDADSLLNLSACNIPVCTLGHTEHLIYQIFHVAKHFALDSLPLRYLSDLTFFVNTYFHQIDLKRFWVAMKQLNYEKFSNSLFVICTKCLGMNSNMLHPHHSKDKINERLLIDIFTSGKDLTKDLGHWASTASIVPYFLRKNKIATSNLQKTKSRFFPSADELNDHFAYAKKHKFLLPIAWVHRFFNGLVYALRNLKRKRSTTKILGNADYRLSLLQELDMLDEK